MEKPMVMALRHYEKVDMLLPNHAHAHAQELVAGTERMRQAFDERNHTGKRTVFVEMSEEAFQNRLPIWARKPGMTGVFRLWSGLARFFVRMGLGTWITSRSKQSLLAELDPHMQAILEARKRGWDVVHLDPKRIMDIRQSIQKRIEQSIDAGTRELTRQLFDEEVHLGTTVRERYWAHRLKSAQKNDIVIVHPGHVAPLIKLAGIPSGNVIWIHATRESGPIAKRLSPAEEQKLAKFRKAEREQRRWK